MPLIDEKLRARQSASERADDAGLDRHARQLIKVKDAPGKDFTEFAAFDLSMDEQVATALGGVRDGIRATDLPVTELQCLRSLVRLEPNVTEVAAFLQKSLTILGELEGAARWRDLVGPGVQLPPAGRRAARASS